MLNKLVELLINEKMCIVDDGNTITEFEDYDVKIGDDVIIIHNAQNMIEFSVNVDDDKIIDETNDISTAFSIAYGNDQELFISFPLLAHQC